jgi:hypothetical protein
MHVLVGDVAATATVPILPAGTQQGQFTCQLSQVNPQDPFS